MEMRKVECADIAGDIEKWRDYMDTDATMTEAEFDQMELDAKIALVHSIFPGECNCGK